MWDSTIQLFRTIFLNKKEPLIIYGTGKIASALLPNIKDYNIVGILDKEKTSGSWYGIPFLDLGQIGKYHANTIVIVAAPRNIPVIYRRIEQFCKANQIRVCDIRGRDLSEVYDLYESNIPYFQKDWSDLHAAVEQHKIISFDIFDTLLIRDSLYPEAVFNIMEQRIRKIGIKLDSFFKLRIAAVTNLNANNRVANIYEIYDEIQRISNITNGEKDYLVKQEIEIEKNLIKPRSSMLAFFNEVKKKKSVYLVSNMHLTKEIIEDILNNCGYFGYKELLVSCEYGKGKESGLFDLLIEKAGVPSAHILHIGDSLSMDDFEPRKVGIDTFPIMSMIDMASNSSYATLLEHGESVLSQLVLGEFLKWAFDDPFVLYGTRGRLRVSSLGTYVSLFLSPLAFLYTLWLLKETKKVGADYILYTSRDAYLLKKMADIILSASKNMNFTMGEYFYASRRATSLAAVFDEADAKELANRSFNGSVKDMFFMRFGIQIEGETFCAEIEEDELERYVRMYQTDIIKHAGEQRKNYDTYIRKCNIQQAKCIAVVDQRGFGNVQKGLARIMPKKRLYGLFLKKFRGVISEHDSSSFFPYNDSDNSYGGLDLASLILEQFLSSPEPSLVALDDEGSPLFENESRNSGQIDDLERMHTYALSYCEKMCGYMEDIVDENSDWKLADKILSLLDEKYTDISVPELENMIVEDYFGEASIIKVN